MKVIKNKRFCFFLFLLIANCSGLIAGDHCYDSKRNQQQISRIVWRKNQDIKFVLAGREVFLDCLKIHHELKEKVAKDIQKIQSLEKDGTLVFNNNYWEKEAHSWLSRSGDSSCSRYQGNRLRPGNFAAASIQVILDDGTYEEFPVTPRPQTSTAVSSYTTLKYGTQERGRFITYNQSCVDALKKELQLKTILLGNPQGDLGGYIDTELQICADLFYGTDPQILQMLKKIQQKVPIAKVQAIILHLYSERDPCGWCGPMLVKLSEEINTILSQTGLSKGKKISPINRKNFLKHVDEILKEVRYQEKPTQSSNFDSYCEFFREQKNEIKQTIDKLNVDTELLKKTRLENLYRSCDSIVEDVDPSKGAKFWVVVSSDEEVAGSRAIGIDWMYSRKTHLDNQPIVFCRAKSDSFLDQYLEIPAGYVIFTLNDGKKFDVSKAIDVKEKLPNEKTLDDLINDFVEKNASYPCFPLLSQNRSLPVPICGLRNLGNTCYFNATMQALASLDFFQKINTTTVDDNISKEVFQLLQRLRTGQGTVTPRSLDSIVKKAQPQWEVGVQQDAHEFLTPLLSSLAEEMSTIRDAVTGQITTQILCKKSHSSSQTDDFTILHFSLENQGKTSSLDDLLSKFLETQELQAYECLSCLDTHNRDSRIEATKQQKLTKVPRILIVQLERFNSKGEKILAPIKYEKNWNLQTGDVFQTFELKGVIHHQGNQLENGHYTATVLGSDAKWYAISDSVISSSSNPHEPLGTEYLLFYEEVPIQKSKE